jgi:hypothetical protein
VRIYSVVFSNYEPEEVDSCWATRELAEQRAEEMEGDWRVVSMWVYTSREEWVEGN